MRPSATVLQLHREKTEAYSALLAAEQEFAVAARTCQVGSKKYEERRTAMERATAHYINARAAWLRSLIG